MSAKHIYTVYKTTNNINGKIYIGVHKTTKPDDYYLGSGINLKRAIKKYGKENFTKEILFEFDRKKDAFKKETEIVTEEFVKSKNTYNMREGGYGGFETKDILSFKGIYKTSLEDFVNVSKIKHNYKFDYSLIKEWKGIKHKVEIICPIHGIFKQVAESHKKGIGCNLCGRIDAAKSLKETRKNKYWKSR